MKKCQTGLVAYLSCYHNLQIWKKPGMAINHQLGKLCTDSSQRFPKQPRGKAFELFMIWLVTHRGSEEMVGHYTQIHFHKLLGSTSKSIFPQAVIYSWKSCLDPWKGENECATHPILSWELYCTHSALFLPIQLLQSTLRQL